MTDGVVVKLRRSTSLYSVQLYKYKQLLPFINEYVSVCMSRENIYCTRKKLCAAPDEMLPATNNGLSCSLYYDAVLNYRSNKGQLCSEGRWAGWHEIGTSSKWTSLPSPPWLGSERCEPDISALSRPRGRFWDALGFLWSQDYYSYREPNKRRRRTSMIW